MPEATELLHSNLLEVFGERDRDRRWAAIGRTYREDVTFTDPDGDFVGWQALPVARGVDFLTIRDGRVSAVRTLIAPQPDA